VREDHEPYAQRVANALALIGTHDPNRMRRIQRDLSAILVWPLVSPGAGAEYHPTERVCALYSKDIKDKHSALVALSIVHEATHARLAAIAVTWENIARIEAICLRQELAFAERLPGGERLVAHLAEKLAAFSSGAYTRGAQNERHLAALEREGAPGSVLSLLRYLARRAGD